ncbi:ATPase [Variovorax sp. UC74_104]|uniref:ATPase n=1 Tax=Variovorax sp. UC74_104 TaxID=3374555 RepID=UPI003757906F
MNEKSHVSLERHLCLVCGLSFDTGGILLDGRLRQRMQRHTVTGWGLCEPHRQLFDEGFVALIECDPERSGVPADQNRMKPEQAWRTGRLVHLKREALARAIDVALAPEVPCVFVEPGVIERLQAVVGPAH